MKNQEIGKELDEQKQEVTLDEVLAADAAPEMKIDPLAMDMVAASRARDSAQAREALGLNAIEPNIERQQQQLAGEDETKRSAWLKKAEEANAGQPAASDKSPSGNQVESDEIFTARQSDVKQVVPLEIENQYLRVGDKFYHSKNTDLLAFEDKGNKLETKSNSENIAESMVRIAEARGWDEIKVSGSEAFRKEVWLEAASRGMHVKGYEPSEQDKAALAKRMSEVDANKIEKDNKPFRARENEKEQPASKSKVDATKEATLTVPVRDDRGQVVGSEKKTVQLNSKDMERAEAFSKLSTAEAVKKHPELAGAAAAVAVMDKKAEADGLNPAQRAIVSARVRENVVNSIERGNIPEVKIKEEIEVKRESNQDLEASR